MTIGKEKSTTRWLRQRAIGQANLHHKPNSCESIKRLQLENVLNGHQGCVNCLDWNTKGDLLASGSDDRKVILWQPLNSKSQRRPAVIQTGHEGTIFSVKFIPQSQDNLIATCASDHTVRVINSLTGSSILKCQSCHKNRVKRLEVHPNEPNLIWSAAEDGLIMQYDLREEHLCDETTVRTKPKNSLIDLKSFSDYSVRSAKCLAISPVRDEMLAVGSEDVYVRLFDRRLLRQTSLSSSCTTHFSPGHLVKKQNHLKSSLPTTQFTHHSPSIGITYLAFSPSGSELLANYHAEQVYLFDIYEPYERYKSFETTAKPLILDQPLPIIPGKILKHRKTFSQWRELKKLPTSEEISSLPVIDREFYESLNKKLRSKSPLLIKDYNTLNSLLAKTKNCPDLYHLRASALIQRGWRGDFYQAIRDCCCALALKPLDHQALENLAFASYFVSDKEAVHGLLEIMKILQAEFGAQYEAIDALTACMVRDSSPPNSSPTWFYDNPGLTAYEGQLTPPNSEVQMQVEDHDDHIMLLNSNNNSPRDTLISRMMDINGSGGCYKQQFEWPSDDNCSFDAFDYSKRFCGHCNMNTDIKEVNFFGSEGEFIVGGSDDGAFYIWDKETTNIVKAVHGDLQVLNCLQAHPSIYMLATSGIEPTVKLWSPSGKKSYDVKSLDTRCAQNQVFINSDPLEAMMMMLYPAAIDRDI